MSTYLKSAHHDEASPDSDSLKNRLRLMAGENPDWLNGLVLSLAGDSLHIAFIHAYFAKWFWSEKRAAFEKYATKALEKPDLEFIYEKDQFPVAAKTSGLSAIAGHYIDISIEAGKPTEEPDYFSSFLANDKNAAALKAARQICQPSGEKSACRLLIFRGSSASGKSHLLKAIYCSLRHDGMPALLCNASSFCARIAANRDPDLPGIFWSRHAALLIDDLQDIVSEPSWQNFLAIYVDAAFAQKEKGRLVFACGGSGSEFGNLKGRLLSRLEGGLIIELKDPDLDVRLRWLEKENRERKLALSREQLLLLARRGRHIPVLQGLLRKIEFFAKLHGVNPAHEDLETMIQQGCHAAPPSWQDILGRVAAKFGLATEEIMSRKRRPDLVLARQVAMYVCRIKLGFSYPELGRIFGGKDHSTVMHGIKKIQALAASDKDMHKLLTEMEEDGD